MNFSDEQRTVTLDKQYKNVVTGEAVDGKITLDVCGYIILEA
jgi:beta-galactosidase GanA